jgi:apolipoprotein N-acyltransferase
MNKYKLVTLSVTGGFLSGLAWAEWCSGLILLIAFVPFFMIENWLFENPRKFTRNAFIIYIMPGLVIFSMMGMGWMKEASLTGAVCVILGLALLMAITMWLAHRVRVKAGSIAGCAAMIAFWLTYEFLSLNINIISPWINLGNGLAKDIMFIQWYEVTGTAGGSLWILLSNLLLTSYIVNRLAGKNRSRVLFLIWLAIVLIPSIVSVNRYFTIKPSGITPSEVTIIQPNTDPYTQKFVIPFEDQLKRVIAMAGTSADKNTDWIITPETTVDDPVNLDNLPEDRYIIMIKKLAATYPGAAVVTGLVSYKVYPGQASPPTRSARLTDSSGVYYDHFNSAFKIDTGRIIEVYHKSKLVPGVEMQFSNGPGRLITRILPYLGGTKWGYGMQDERTCFHHNSLPMKIAPIICYESVFGSYVTGYVKNGAEALFIITNDGWWKNTNGYKHHLYYASLRAIETRRPVARAANTGISCLIDIRGRRTAESEWWTPAIVKGEIIPDTRITPYVKYGDYLLKISVVVSIIIILAVYVLKPARKKRSDF